MIVRFFYLTTISLSHRTRLKRFLASIFTTEHCFCQQLNIVFCTDDYLLEINREFLDHDFYTDIVTFNLAKKGEPVSGEVYISVDRVRDNSVDLNVPFRRELHRVIIHGVLHLCGYSDKRKKEVTAMREAEDKYLDLYFNSST